MTASKIVLQRLRLCHLEFHAEPPNKQFKLPLWQKKAALAYWTSADEGVSQSPEQVEFAKDCSVSSDTFFNAFYTGHWRRLTCLESLFLRIGFSGEFLLEVFSHTERGEAELLESVLLDGPGETEFEVAIPPEKIRTSLRLNFKLTSRKDGSRLRGGDWRTTDLPIQPVRLSIGITTYNRHEFAQRLIQKILGDSALEKEDIQIQVIDQSDISRLDHLNEDRIRITRQKNLGSSGGFSRAIHECVYAGRDEQPTHILLMDDDVEIETDSILRAIRMAQFAKAPFLLGGTQLDLYHPTCAYSMGETFQKDAYGYYDGFRALKTNLLSIDASLPNYMNAISVPYATDYCGWWFCMIPVEAILKMKLPVQFFVKADDVEYGLRAKSLGYLSHTIAGVGLWHPPPNSKSAAWIRYMDFYTHLMLNSFCGYPEVANLLQMQAIWALQEIAKHKYQNAAAMIRAMEDYLGGWSFYRNRTFPDYIVDLKRDVATYEANDKSVPTIRQEQFDALRDRLTAVVLRVKQDGPAAQASMKENLPKTTDPKAWEYYFAHGNHAELFG